MKTQRRPRTLALGTLGAIAALKLILHLAAIGQYGYFRDELYYLASTEHLSWGYVDHPPLSIFVLAVVRALFGDSLIALRMVPALAGVATVGLTGVIAWQLGGSRFAQALAALAALFSPVFLGTDHFYSMNALELLFWTGGASLVLVALESRRARDWLWLGILLGLGLLNKISMSWFAAGLVVGCLFTPYRRVFRERGIWLAGVTAGLFFLPHVVWQIQHGWPTLEFMHNATSQKMATVSPLSFLTEQILSNNPGAFPIWLGGLVFGLVRTGPRARVLAWIYLTVFALLIFGGHSRPSYLAPAYPMVFALGGVAIERVSLGYRWMQPLAVSLIVVSGLVALPMTLPVLPVNTFVRYQAALRQTPSTDERQEMGVLPQHYADMFGWDDVVALVARAYAQLTPEEKQRARVFGQNYGEAGAVDVLGQKLGLPRAMSGHNSYWLWGPGSQPIDVLIIIGGDREDNAQFFDDITIVGQTSSPWSMPYERGLDVSIARKPKLDLRTEWSRVKEFI